MYFNYAIDIHMKPESLFLCIVSPNEHLLRPTFTNKNELPPDTHHRIGMTFKEVKEHDGMEIEMQGEITGYVKNKSMSFQLESKIHIIDITYAIIDHGQRSTLEVIGTIKWKFPMNIFSFIFSSNVEENIARQTKAELEELKILCEEQHIEEHICERRRRRDELLMEDLLHDL